MPPIEAYEIGEGGTHIAVSTGDAPTSPAGQGDASGSAGTGTPADTGASAPPQASPPQDQGLAAPDGAGEETDLDETAALSPEEFAASRRRINQLNGRWRAEQRRREADRQVFEQRLAQQQGQLEAFTKMLQGAAPDLPPPGPSGPPQAEQFASHEDYVLAAARYGAQQELQAREQQTQQERSREQMQQMQRDLMEREAAFKQAHPDFDEVVRSGLAGKVAPHVQQALMLLPEGPALAYQLAQQHDLVQRLNTLPPPLVFAELGRLSGPGGGSPFPPTQERAHADVPAQTTTNGTRPPPLPEPMRPVGGGGSPQPPGLRDDASQEDYRAWRARTSNLPRWKTG